MVKFRDTDFLHAAARIRSLEKNMLTGRSLNQMVEASSVDEAWKIVNDAGIGVGVPVREYERALTEGLLETHALLQHLANGSDVFQIFRYEYDALNLKVLVKSQALDKDPTDSMSDLGCIPAGKLREQFKNRKLDGLHPLLAQAAMEALEELARTNDPQTVDILLDKAALQAMRAKAGAFDNRFIRRYVEAKVDISNIRCAVRLRRIGAPVDLLRKVLCAGGTMGVETLVEAYLKGMESVVVVLEHSAFGPVLEPALADLRSGGSLALFERQCDNYMVRLLGDARLVPFGIEPLVAYLCAREGETKAARIVLASRLADVSPEQIKERLRESYA